MAVGATSQEVMRLVLGRTAVLLVVGAGLGSLVAGAAGSFLSPILYNVSPRDPASFALALLLMTVVAAFAAWLPAVQAARIEPSSALRED